MNYIDRTKTSRELFEEARRLIPGGSAYSIRYFEPYPFYVRRAKGSRIWDVDGNEYLDFWMIHFAAILGHGYEPIINAVKEQLDYGAHFGWCCEWEVKWAEAVCRWFEAEMAKPANSGTEANMYAVRLARAYTGKRKIGKIEGGWHGGYDGLHAAVNYPYDKPSSLGLTNTENIVPLPFNDLEATVKIAEGEDLAGIILEPVLGSAGVIPASGEYLKGLREFCSRRNMVLIFDEVITGFRHHGGMQNYFKVKPDLITLGKTVGGQYFAGAGGICGTREIMSLLDQTERPEFWNRSFHGGTYVGNALTMHAGYVTIKELEKRSEEIYPYINSLGEKTRRRIKEVLDENRVEAYVTGLLSMTGLHLTREKPVDGLTAERTKNRDLSRKLFLHMLQKGIVYLRPETPHFAISAAHTEEDVERLVRELDEFIKKGG
jgi:glutamate-1-semialdehyde 2,1-aminomutase